MWYKERNKTSKSLPSFNEHHSILLCCGEPYYSKELCVKANFLLLPRFSLCRRLASWPDTADPVYRPPTGRLRSWQQRHCQSPRSQYRYVLEWLVLNTCMYWNDLFSILVSCMYVHVHVCIGLVLNIGMYMYVLEWTGMYWNILVLNANMYWNDLLSMPACTGMTCSLNILEWLVLNTGLYWNVTGTWVTLILRRDRISFLMEFRKWELW